MRSRPPRPARSRPSKAMAPSVGCSWSRISLDVVVLPQPDSPMRPRVSPAPIVKSIPSTALTDTPPRPSSPVRTGKCFLSPRTSSTGGGMVHEPAAGDAAVALGEVARFFARAARQRLGAAGVEGAARRQARQVRRLARDRVERLLAAELRHRAEQCPRVGVLGRVEQLADGRLLDDPAGI